jgi:hypothetical protein
MSHMSTNQKGKTVNSHERSAKTQSPRTGIFAAPHAFLNLRGSGAPSSRQTARFLVPFVAVMFVCFLLIGVASAAAAGPPTIVGESSESVSETTATIKGKVNPGGVETYVSVDYNGSFTAPVRMAASEAEQPVSFSLKGLQPNTNYAFHLHAVNSEGEIDGPEQKFATLKPPPANDETPWWHIAAGARPAYLQAGGRKPAGNEVQEFTLLKPTLFLIAPTVTAHEIEEEEFFEAGKVIEVKVSTSAQELKEGLESLEGYGPGSVEVQSPAAGIFKVTFIGPLAEHHVALMREPAPNYKGQASFTELTAGHPPTPDGEIYVTAENLGNGDVEASKEAKVQFTDVLPKNLKAIAVVGSKPFKEGSFNKRESIPCTLEEKAEVQIATCTLSEPLAPFDQLEMRIGVDVEPGAASGEVNETSISGAGTPPRSLKRPVTISSAPVPFGLDLNEIALEEEGGVPATQAGAHPFQLTSTITLNQLADIEVLQASAKPEVTVPALAKDVNVKLPPGLIGNPTPIPQCSTAQFFQTHVNGDAEDNACPASSAVGVATVTVHEPSTVGTAIVTEPIFNLEPRVGEPARFGFYVVIANSPVFIDTSVRTGGDYGVTVEVSNITQTAAFLSSETSFWGVPGDSRHDLQRGWGCIDEARGIAPRQPCIPSEEAHPKPFLVLPTSCKAALGTSVDADSWTAPGSFQLFTGQFEPAAPLSSCNRLQFAPQIKVAPDGQEASKPTGLTVDVHVPQEVNENAQGLASSNLKTITVAFPPGVTLNPSAADGLQACSEAQVGLLGGVGEQGEFLFTPTLPEAFCPDASKIGTVKISSPLLPKGQLVEGSLYLASPAPNGELARNPFNTLLAMYIIAKDPISGTLVKLPGVATLDPNTGQITSTFDNSPQLAFEDAEIHLFGGERAPLASPSHCGLYTTNATFTPWSGTAPITSKSSFEVTSGPNGSPCPPAALPFSPSLTAGSTNINAGSFSPLSTTINREDVNQQIQAVQLHFPPGLSGILKGVELCPEASANAGTCGAGSLIGKTIVSVGLGGDPFSVTGGQVFLTEGYKGAPFGLSIVNPAVAGPFDLGKVIVRAKVEVDPHTAALTVTTDESGPYAIPHILKGIPLQIKHINVLIDRPGFTFNPTNCAPQSITGAIASAEGASAPLSTRFQVTNCANLKFAPKFSASTAGKTSKASGASLKVKLTYPSSPAGTYANLSKAKVSLPKQLPSRLTTLQKACTATVFEQNPANCPKESIVGQAKVITPLLPVALSGPAYFVSHGGEAFPDLTIVLKGYGLTVDLVGSTQIKKGVTTSTFKATPDVPFSSFELTLPQGKFSALAANANLCKSKLTMPSEFTAQNGAILTQQTKIAVSGCPKPLTRQQQMHKALKACQKKGNHAKRKACEGQARKRFASKAKKPKKKKG